jgi:hypothetical protein
MSYAGPAAAHPGGTAAAGWLLNHVAPRNRRRRRRRRVGPERTATPDPSGVFANTFQLSVNAPPATSKAHDSPAAVQAPIGSLCESWIAAATRPSIEARSGLSFSGATANPRRVPSEERSA